jgi:hypothetical protein
MKLVNAVLGITLLASSSAFALGRTFDEAVSQEEAARLLKSVASMQEQYEKTTPAMERLKHEGEVQRSPQLTQAAVEVLKSYTTVGVFLAQIRDGLTRRDSKVNAYEIELKSEIDVFTRRLQTLRERARADSSPAVQHVVSQALPATTELAALYIAFDANYLVAISDVDVFSIPTVDVFAAVKFQNPYLAGDERSRFDTARAE